MTLCISGMNATKMMPLGMLQEAADSRASTEKMQDKVELSGGVGR